MKYFSILTLCKIVYIIINKLHIMGREQIQNTTLVANPYCGMDTDMSDADLMVSLQMSLNYNFKFWDVLFQNFTS